MKTPAILEVRKLATRKGFGSVIITKHFDSWVVEIDNDELRGIGAYSQFRGDALSMFFASLSALPDKKKKQQ